MVWGSTARWIDLDKPDVMALPPTASLIAEGDWTRMVKEAGGEMPLLKTLGVKEIEDDNGTGIGDPGDFFERKG